MPLSLHCTAVAITSAWAAMMLLSSPSLALCAVLLQLQSVKLLLACHFVDCHCHCSIAYFSPFHLHSICWMHMHEVYWEAMKEAMITTGTKVVNYFMQMWPYFAYCSSSIWKLLIAFLSPCQVGLRADCQNISLDKWHINAHFLHMFQSKVELGIWSYRSVKDISETTGKHNFWWSG